MPGVLIFPLDCFVGLAVAGVEVTAPGYVRQPATLATTADGTDAANTATLQWSHATAPWGVVDTALIYDAISGGGRIGSLPTLVPIAIRQYDSVRIPAGGMVAIQATISRAYGIGRWGTYGYGTASMVTTGAGVNLQRTFAPADLCSPGTWAPGPFSMAA